MDLIKLVIVFAVVIGLVANKKQVLFRACFLFAFLCVYALFVAFSSVFLFAVFASVDFFFRICQHKNVIQPLLDGSDAARVFALDHVYNLFRKSQFLFLHNGSVFDDVYGDVVVDEAKNIQIQLFDRTFHLDDIFFAHLVAAGILDDGYSTV